MMKPKIKMCGNCGWICDYDNYSLCGNSNRMHEVKKTYYCCYWKKRPGLKEITRILKGMITKKS